MTTYKKELAVKMKSNGHTLTVKTPGRGGLYKIALTPHPTKKDKALVQHWDLPWKCAAWMACCKSAPAQYVIPMDAPWEKSYRADAKMHEIVQKRYEEQHEWREKCKKADFAADLTMGTYVVIDPCYLPKRPKVEEKIGTVFEVERLEGGGYQWRMFGDGPGVDSGMLCIIPAAQCPGAFDDGQLAKKAYSVLRRVKKIEWTCARRKDNRLKRINARTGGRWNRRLEIHVRGGGWHMQPDDVLILPNDRSVTEW